MQIKLRFLGAAQNVTGSRHMLEVNGTRLLVDCGLYQERQFKDRNWEPFDVPAASIDAVLLTHAHLDHCGLLPKLVREGFKGAIYCTGATAEIARIILLDSAHLQEEDAEYKRKRHEREGRTGPHPQQRRSLSLPPGQRFSVPDRFQRARRPAGDGDLGGGGNLHPVLPRAGFHPGDVGWPHGRAG